MLIRIIPIAALILLGQSVSDSTLPKDVHPESRSRLAPINRGDLDERRARIFDTLTGPTGAAALRLHSSGGQTRWDSPLGRAATELAIVATARRYDTSCTSGPCTRRKLWLSDEPAVLDVVRYRKPLAGVSDKEAALIEVMRDVVGKHTLTADVYARAVKVLGERNLVDVVDLASGGRASRRT